MKVSTYYKNVGKILDECIEKNPTALLYENTDDGVYFVKDKEKAYYAYFLPKYCVASVSPDLVDSSKKNDGILSSACNAVAYLADKVAVGTNTLSGKKTVRISNNNGVVQFFNKTYINKFPDNADFYLKSTYEPAVVGIWDKKEARLHICGCVCPLAITDNEFVAD